jgi:flagellar biosynthesis anti-sigma factor FlgM
VEFTMKIDGNRPAHDTAATESARRTTTDAGLRPGGHAGTTGSTDRVELSSDATVRAAALKAANETPEIRTELVDRMREKLNAGQLGADSLRLADAIIDDLLK